MTFETEADVDNQIQVMSILEKTWNVKIFKMKSLNSIDCFSFRNSDLVGLLEIKCRSHESTKYPTVFLAWRKWIEAMRAAEAFRVSVVYVVKFADKIGFADLTVMSTDGLVVRWKGRKDRALVAVNDEEAIIEIPVHLFKWLK